ncbi:ribonuclease H-like protein [Aspergillus sclerotiicarbonarius CBS 121057]|uniref:ribonuclease H n=1 Tax=Aspergillus sclerotiicarbonarius (strain CBS 121057 / IBT 28362) TaxID=1448318 RepID=A0A319EN34_ASPSB|nr:ribonuclease H-like protein [Aspergillus sclerotiicarbonarius CBS 121057]
MIENYSGDLRLGTGRVLPTKFNPPNASDKPQDLFPPGVGFNVIPIVSRFIRRNDREQLLLYTDGACQDNGGDNPRAGYSVVFRPSLQPPPATNYLACPVETQGPTGEEHPQTSNRAELRAVIAACRFRVWTGEGFTKLVIATDSEYVVEGATSRVRGWIQRGWKTSTGEPVKNQDLWKFLLGEIERWYEAGLQIQFWRIPRDWNAEADHYAKQAASKTPPDEFQLICGMFA